MIAASGFREYDARWEYPAGIGLEGMEALGLGLGTQMHWRGIAPRLEIGNSGDWVYQQGGLKRSDFG